jgi:two-component system phosphate regulon sensor histidine kinase PhoR
MLSRRQIRHLERENIIYKDNHEALRREVNQLSHMQDLLTEAIEEGVILLDASQRIFLANPMATTLSTTSLIGKTPIVAFRHKELDDLVQDASHNLGELQERLIDLDGCKYQARVKTVGGKGGSVTAIVLRDITVLKKLQRARHEMVANISHELRTPITTIGLLADTLQDEKLRKSKKGGKMINNILREVSTLTQLVQEMRDLAQIESGQMPLKLMPMDLEIAVKNSVEPLLALIEDKKQTIEISLPTNITVLADHTHIERVIKNIVHNAIKFTPDGKMITVNASLSVDEATVAIKNEGQGIAAEDLPRIFERFFQADQSRHDGTGLGLAIARHIVQGHGGNIWAESEQGKETTFFFTLPLDNEHD